MPPYHKGHLYTKDGCAPNTAAAAHSREVGRLSGAEHMAGLETCHMCLSHEIAHVTTMSYSRYLNLLQCWIRGDDFSGCLCLLGPAFLRRGWIIALRESYNLRKGWLRHEALNSSWNALGSQKGDPCTGTERWVTNARSDIYHTAFHWASPCSYAENIDSVRAIPREGKRLMVERWGPSVHSGWLKRAV